MLGLTVRENSVYGKSPRIRWALIPILTYLVALITWPIAGLGNDGHCDAWYYWGMGHSSKVLQNVFALDYYYASRAPLYLLGWLIPDSINPIIWSKLLMLLGVVIPTCLIFIGLKRRYWFPGIGALFLVNLFPIIFSQSSANYSGVTFNLLAILGLTLFFGTNNFRSQFAVGLIASLVIFANIETLVLVPPILFLYLVTLKEFTVKKMWFTLLGIITSYLSLFLSLLLGGLNFYHSVTFPFIQVKTLFEVVGDRSFFGPLENAWYVGTPLLMFHLSLIFLLLNRKIKSLEVFPPALPKVMTIQLIFLIIGQVTGFAVTFQSGFDAIIAYWPLVSIMVFCFIKLPTNNRMNFFLFGAFPLVFLLVSQWISLLTNIYLPAFQLFLFSIALPCLFVLITTLVLFSKNISRTLSISILITLLPLLCIHTVDYSYAFYSSDNQPIKYGNIATAHQYEAATLALKEFEGELNGPTAIGAIEDPNNSFQVSMLRASVRSFSSCGLPWSSFSNLEDLMTINTDSWPNKVIVGSYRELNNSEILKIFPKNSGYKKIKFTVDEQDLFWTIVRK